MGMFRRALAARGLRRQRVRDLRARVKSAQRRGLIGAEESVGLWVDAKTALDRTALILETRERTRAHNPSQPARERGET